MVESKSIIGTLGTCPEMHPEHFKSSLLYSSPCNYEPIDTDCTQSYIELFHTCFW